MFQFSDDDDLDVEDLLNLPHEKSINGNQHRSDRTSDSFKDLLENCDDDELILSAIENVDDSITHPQPKPSFESKSRTPNLKDKTIRKECVGINNQSIIEKYTVSDNIKHKLPVTCDLEITKAPRIEYERKFPGPAGLIPKKVSKQNTPVKAEISTNGSPKVDLPSNNVILENGCWEQLVTDIENISSKLKSMLDENTVVSVKRMNIIHNTPRKLPFFAAVIVNIDCSVCDPSIILKDSTGEIRGTLHKDLWENHNSLLTVGTALLMKQVSVLSITNSRKLYVNVTSNNIVRIYTPQPAGSPVLITQLAEISERDFVQTKKSDRMVFEETHPNKMINNVPPSRPPWGKPTVTPKSLTISVTSIKTDNKIDENKVPSTSKFKPKLNQFVKRSESVKLSKEKLPIPNQHLSQIQVNKDLISNELEGIDADSLFGEF